MSDTRPKPSDPDESGAQHSPLDYQALPSPLAALRPDERRVAWAVVRAMATAMWLTGVVLALAWLVISARHGSWLLVPGVPAFASLTAAAVLEYHAKELRSGLGRR
jgi:hypothetical protein